MRTSHYPCLSALAFLIFLCGAAQAQQPGAPTAQPPSVIDQLRAQASNGDANAKGLLQRMEEKAPVTIEQVGAAAASGDVNAQTMLGVMHEKGMLMTPDPSAAVQWYRAAANQGNTSGQELLGRAYAKGLGVAQDEVEAMVWFHKAVVGGLAQQAKSPDLFAGGVQGVIRSSEKDNPMAVSMLGRMYLAGQGVEQSDAEAARWLLASQRMGSRPGTAFGLLLEEGRGGLPKDPIRAFQLYLDGAELSFQNTYSALELSFLELAYSQK